ERYRAKQALLLRTLVRAGLVRRARPRGRAGGDNLVPTGTGHLDRSAGKAVGGTACRTTGKPSACTTWPSRRLREKPSTRAGIGCSPRRWRPRALPRSSRITWPLLRRVLLRPARDQTGGSPRADTGRDHL